MNEKIAKTTNKARFKGKKSGFRVCWELEGKWTL